MKEYGISGGQYDDLIRQVKRDSDKIRLMLEEDIYGNPKERMRNFTNNKMKKRGKK